MARLLIIIVATAVGIAMSAGILIGAWAFAQALETALRSIYQ